MRQGFRMSVNEKNIHPFICLMTKSPAVDSELGFRITARGSAIGASLRCTVDKLHRPGRLFHRLYVECGISFRPCIHSIVAEIGIDQIMSHESIDTAAVPGHIFRSRTGKISYGRVSVVLSCTFQCSLFARALLLFRAYSPSCQRPLPLQLPAPLFKSPFAFGNCPLLLSV